MVIIVFYLSLIFLAVMITVKTVRFPLFEHEVISKIACENDKHCHEIVGKSRHLISKIKFKNFHKLAVIIIEFLKREAVYLKRKFDSQQPKFFLGPQKTNSSKHSVSFFLKSVSEYKDSLKKDR